MCAELRKSSHLPLLYAHLLHLPWEGKTRWGEEMMGTFGIFVITAPSVGGLTLSFDWQEASTLPTYVYDAYQHFAAWMKKIKHFLSLWAPIALTHFFLRRKKAKLFCNPNASHGWNKACPALLRMFTRRRVMSFFACSNPFLWINRNNRYSYCKSIDKCG